MFDELISIGLGDFISDGGDTTHSFCFCSASLAAIALDLPTSNAVYKICRCKLLDINNIMINDIY